MRPIIQLTGIVLIILGIVTLGYQGFTYTTREKVLQIGELEVTAENEKTIMFPPLLGGLSLATGIILVIVGRNNKKQ